MSDEILPFRIDVTDADLADLQTRLTRTRWPDAETVDDWSQGIPLHLDKGGNFAAFEQPEVFVDEVRTFFRTVR